VIFVTGDAGSGKTALIQEFAQYAHDTRPDLVVAVGNCNAHTGIGDPYLPFREILELLAGDVEAQWAAGALTSDHALRLWNVLPITGEALVESGPDLINTFIPGDRLARHAQAHQTGNAVWKTRLLELVERKAAAAEFHNLNQTALFEQITRVLRAISRQAPLVLIVDDLQWADLGSISLLFHLGRQLAGSRILLIGAYRPEEIAIGRDGERHPLASVTRELQRLYGDMLVDLDLAERSDFVDAVLDSEPNRLGSSFRQLLFRQTNGHPLFTIELLRGLQERGDLRRDVDGRWIEGPYLDWEKQPARVEAVVAERVGRLAPPLREALRVASVEGELFTAEVVAQIRGSSEQDMLEQLSGDLDRRHQLVRAHSIVRTDGRLLSHYRFRHIQIQKYLYSSLDEVERVHLHERVGSVLENLYGGNLENATIAPQLARHFQEAGITDKAIRYLHLAGERALQLSAYQEAIVHLSNSLSLLNTQPESGDRTSLELDLQLTMGQAWLGKGHPTVEIEAAYARARDLGRQSGLISQLCIAIGGLTILNYVRAQLHQAREFAQEALSMAQGEKQPMLELLGHWYVGITHFALGDFTGARESFDRTIAAYDPETHHHVLLEICGSDGGLSAIAYDACCLWCLGFPDQALKRREEALALARWFGHPFTLEDVLCYAGGILDVMRRDGPSLKKTTGEMIAIAEANNFVGWSRIASILHGEGLARVGETGEGIALMNAGLANKVASGEHLDLPGRYCSLAETQLMIGQLAEAEAALGEAFRWLEVTDERTWEAELHRVQAEWFVATGRDADALESFERALDTARRQQAKSWELRTAVSLARFMQSRGRAAEARRMLAGVNNWFSEGFDTPDLVTARALLDELA
jgi:predicted ATPase